MVRFWPLWKAFHNGHYVQYPIMRSTHAAAQRKRAVMGLPAELVMGVLAIKSPLQSGPHSSATSEATKARRCADVLLPVARQVNASCIRGCEAMPEPKLGKLHIRSHPDLRSSATSNTFRVQKIMCSSSGSDLNFHGPSQRVFAVGCT